MTKKKVRKPRAEAWRAELARIVRFLNKGNYGSRRLWNVLSALRGPDYEPSEADKYCTTSVIRAAIGMNGEPYLPVHVEEDTPEFAARRKDVNNFPFHFKFHAQHAFDALGLTWDEVNEVRKKRVRKTDQKEESQ